MENFNGSGDRIPRELLHTQDERLTNKHSQTLSFLQEMAQENKILKQKVQELENAQEQCKELHELSKTSQARIKEIQEQYLNRSDEINQILADQHRAEMMEVMDEKMEMERTLKEEILKLRHENESLQRINIELREDPDNSEEREIERDKYNKQIKELLLMVERLQIEVKDLTVERKKLQGSLEESQARTSELHQLQDLRGIHRQLCEELRAANQKNIELVFFVERLEKQLKEDQAEKNQTRLVETLKNKLEKVLKEKELTSMMESELRAQLDAAHEVITCHGKNLEALKEERESLLKEQGQMQIELDRLQWCLQQEKNRVGFKEFVAVKRELAAVKNENEELKLKTYIASGSTLPRLKEELLPPVAVKPSKKGKKKVLAITLPQRTGSAQKDTEQNAQSQY